MWLASLTVFCFGFSFLMWATECVLDNDISNYWDVPFLAVMWGVFFVVVCFLAIYTTENDQ